MSSSNTRNDSIVTGPDGRAVSARRALSTAHADSRVLLYPNHAAAQIIAANNGAAARVDAGKLLWAPPPQLLLFTKQRHIHKP
jgi:hypothetical protein